MGKHAANSLTIRELLQSDSLESDEGFQARLSEALLVGSIPAEGEPETSTWSFITRQGIADLTDDPEQFREAQVWPLKARGRLTSWLTRSVTIGRSESNDVWIDSRSLSKIHARFRIRDDQWELADAGSKNGTTLNGAALAANVFQPVKDGDRIHLAGIPCRIYSASKLLRILKFMAPVEDIEGHLTSPPV